MVIAAPASGSGKSVVSMGLMTALSRSSVVQSFKIGPDYIDPGYHTAATGRPSRNLDTWMTPREWVSESFQRSMIGADIAVIEGVMGLFDGYDAKTERGSSAEVAKLLQTPVILVLDVSKMARSAGAMALGYATFDSALSVAGVICNKVGSAKHALWVRQAVEGVGLPVLGCLPRSSHLHVPERHLGLHTAIERAEQVAELLDHAAELISQHIDLPRLRAIACNAPGLPDYVPASVLVPDPVTRIAVARDAAFSFYYEDNFDLLRAAGAEIVPFSPLHDPELPADISGLYLGGGYPELYAKQLAANQTMLQSISDAVAADMPVYAECGGLMVLTEGITDLEGHSWPMVGAVPGRVQMNGRLSMGYRQITASRETFLLPDGATTRGHEFHYSDWINRPDHPPAPYRIAPRMGDDFRADGYAAGNLLASYIHLHFAADPDIASRFVKACVGWAAATPPSKLTIQI